MQKLFPAFLVILLAALPAQAQETGAQSYVVTSVQKCFDMLQRSDIIDIQKNFVKPYEECHRRVAAQAAEREAAARAAKAAAGAQEPAAETPMNYVRVQKIK